LTDDLSLWQTDYIHIMQKHGDIVEWYKGSALRPYLDALADDGLRAEFLTEYTEAIENAYPKEQDNRVLFPFTRIFFVAVKAGKNT
ncbi:MAG: trans-aconitate methyltransferase, partial [Clostridiales bacterium]|nr:trans-aconitate methyltransferase [Clostridiales bacterium]